MKHQATMKAVAAFHPLPIDHPEALLDVEVPTPTPGPRDLLVRVRAVSVNPVDTKMRRASSADGTQPRVLGWDAVGIVEALGAEVRHHRVGDRTSASPGGRRLRSTTLRRPPCRSPRSPRGSCCSTA